MAVNLTGRFSNLIRSLCTVAETKYGGNEVPLYRRLSAYTLGSTGKTVSQTLDEYVGEGKLPRKQQLDACIRELRNFRKYHYALQIMEWMELTNVHLSRGDLAIRLDLISKVRGLAEAETYFEGLSPSEKNQFTYGALLNCYCKGKKADKALAVFEKLDKMGWVSSLAFDNLMPLCMRLGHPEKVFPLVQDMKARNIPLSTFTFNVWIQSLSRLHDIDGVERVFEEMMRDNTVKCDWTVYSNLAVIYVEAGLHEKAEGALKRLETEMRPLKRDAFHFLISLYAATCNLDEVHRIWNSLKSCFKVTNNWSYRIMLQALAKLKDIDGFQKCFKEWETSCSSYDIRLANTGVRTYIRFGKIEEAESVLHTASKRSSGPFLTIWDMFATYYLKNQKIDLAMRCLESAISEGEKTRLGECPWPESVEQFMKYFEEERDVNGAEKLCKSLKKMKCLDNKMYGLLLKTYIAAERKEAEMRKRIEKDGIEVKLELEKLLKKVCP